MTQLRLVVDNSPRAVMAQIRAATAPRVEAWRRRATAVVLAVVTTAFCVAVLCQ